MKSRRSSAAFTLVEAMVSTALAGVLGGIIYLVAGEAVTSFARNVSINRSYTDARLTLDRIAQTIGSAGHAPVLVDATGTAPTGTPAPAGTAYAGVRFFRADPKSNYKITAGTVGPGNSNAKITISLAAGQTAPSAKDLGVIPAIGDQGFSYEGSINSVSTSSTSCELTFANSLFTDSKPTPTASVNLASPQLYLQTYTQVAYIVIGNQLRYYPHAKTTTTDTTSLNNPANYQVLVNLVSSAYTSAGAAATPLLPFSIVNSPTVQVQLYAEAPEYNNRTTARSAVVGSTNTYTFMQCSLGPRSPVMLTRGPY